MKKFRQLPVGKQVLLIFGTLCLILLAVGGLLFFGLRAIERDIEVQQSRVLDELALIDDTAQDIGQLQAAVLRQILASDPNEIKTLDETIHEIEATNTRELTDYQKFVDMEKEKQLYDKVMQARKVYWEKTQPVLAFSQANQDEEATKWVNSTQAPAYDELVTALNHLIDYEENDAKEASQATTHFLYQIRIVSDILVGVTILMMIGSAFAVVTVIRRLKSDNQTLQNEITERKRAEASLRETEEKFRQLADNITDVFWIASPDLEMVHYVSPAYQQIWGRSTESLYAHPHQWAESIVPEERDRVFAIFASLKTNVPEVSAEYQITCPDGAVRWVHARGFQVRNAAGQVVRLTGIVTDITERKRLEARLFQSQKMETIGKLAGGIAHEFNSILTAIIGQSEIILGDLPTDSPLAKNATEIRQAAGRAATLTRQLLAYGRKQILQPEILDLNQIMASMEGMFHHLMGGDVQTQIIPAIGLRAVKADASQIEQVIMNMAINAREAMPNGGKFTLETANVSFDQESTNLYPELKPGSYVMLAITDTGMGMSENVKSRAFEPFFSTKGVGEGTGLGLSTCYGIIKQSGGHISLYSEVARGTSFKIYLPQVEQPAEAPLPRPASHNLPRGTETILLVEDDSALRAMAATLLERLGYTVLTAANGVEALTLKQQRDIGHIDLLFTDVVMPHMNGKELADRMRALYPHTKILFTSAYTESSIVNQGMLEKGVALLQKPFTPSALALKIRETLEQKKPALP